MRPSIQLLKTPRWSFRQNLSPEVTEKVRNYAIKAFEAIEGSGLTRVDFFVTDDEQILINRSKHPAGLYKYQYVSKNVGSHRNWVYRAL